MMSDIDADFRGLLEEELIFEERFQQGLTDPYEEAEVLLEAEIWAENCAETFGFLIDVGQGHGELADSLLQRHAAARRFVHSGGQWHVYLAHLRAGGLPDDFKPPGGVA
jgi:hypothetical protein